MKTKLFLVLVLTAILFSCSGRNMISRKVVIDDEPMLLGKTDQEQLFFDFPEWREVYDAYSPDPEAIKILKNNKKNIGVEIFFGTWCGDSRRDVPAFLKIVEMTRFIPEENISLFAVDRQKKTPGGSETGKNIERVATFLFYSEGEEIGRIVEFPDDTLEKDMVLILGVK